MCAAGVVWLCRSASASVLQIDYCAAELAGTRAAGGRGAGRPGCGPHAGRSSQRGAADVPRSERCGLGGVRIVVHTTSGHRRRVRQGGNVGVAFGRLRL